MDGDSPMVRELTVEECWELLDSEPVGRLAFRLVDEVHLVPVNYVVDGGRLLFRTESGNKLLAAALESDVAFEIDWRDDLTAWSVVARGHLRRLSESEAALVEEPAARPWVEIYEPQVVELQPHAVTGRRFRLRRPEPDHVTAAPAMPT